MACDGKHNPLYTDRFDQVLTHLVGTVGEAKWAEITRQMKTIYGIQIKHKPMVQARWRAIDPSINREPFTADEMVTHWHLCCEHQCHWDAVRAEYEVMGQKRDKCYLSQKFYAHFQFKLIDLNRGLGKIASYNQQKIESMRDTTKKRILEINKKDLSSAQDQSAKEIVLSCKTLIKLLTFAVDNYKMDTRQLIEELKTYITPEKFQRVLYNIFTIDTMVLIACNELKAMDDNPDLLDEKKKQKYKKPTKIKKWDEALQQPSSPEFSEDDDIMQAQIKIHKLTPSTHFTKADIEEIKISAVYGICNTDQNQTFYDWYNEAKIQKATVKTDLLVDVVDELKDKEKQKSERPKPPNKKTALLAKKQMKLIEKKKNFIMQQKNDEKIKTVRGKIKIDKEVFPGCYTKFFDKEDDDEHSGEAYSVIDVDTIYKMNLMMNKKDEQQEQEQEDSIK